MMKPDDISDGRELSQDIGEVVGSVRALGERARFLAVNLAVATAKLKQMQVGGTRLNEELLDLVARVTRVAHDVGEALAAMEAGLGGTQPAPTAARNRWPEIGIPDERTLDRLSQSLNETLDLARNVFRWVRQIDPPSPMRSWKDDSGPWVDDKTDSRTT